MSQIINIFSFAVSAATTQFAIVSERQPRSHKNTIKLYLQKQAASIWVIVC